MKKKLRIGMILTALFLIVWLITTITYAVIIGMKYCDELPNFLLYPVISVAGLWLLVGLYLAVRDYQLIKAELIKFINEK